MSWTKKTLRDTVQEKLGGEMFVVVSNREPYIHRIEGEDVICQVPAGGLTVALDPVMRACGGLWVAHGVGEADKLVVDQNDHVQVPPENPGYTLRRMWLSKQEQSGYYFGFANKALWPLCHIAYTRPVFDVEQWETYKAVNAKFAQAILDEIGDRNAFVFIQDYHFAMLPRLIKRPNIRIAQFWHIPWPNPEVFQICPWATDIVDGLLGNDLLGFHTRYHCQNFLDSVNRLLEARVDYELQDVMRGGIDTKVRPFPISVDYHNIDEFASSPEVEAEMQRLVRHFGLRDKVVCMGVDRIDYTKGIPERLRAIDRLLDNHPELCEKMVYIQVSAHSRQQIAEYQKVYDEVANLTQNINWKHGIGNWKPIIQCEPNVPPLMLQALYRLANAFVVSSLHDGMNLVAKEYVSSRVNNTGALVLSQFTGSAQELSDALLVSPYDIEEMAGAIYEAIVMPEAEQKRRMERMRQHIEQHNIYLWAGRVLSSLFDFEFARE